MVKTLLARVPLVPVLVLSTYLAACMFVGGLVAPLATFWIDVPFGAAVNAGIAAGFLFGVYTTRHKKA